MDNILAIITLTNPTQLAYSSGNGQIPYKLISLYDLLGWRDVKPFIAQEFYETGNLLAQVREVMATSEPTAKASGDAAKHISVLLNGVARRCNAVELTIVSEYAIDLSQRIARESMSHGEVDIAIGELDRLIAREMKKRLYFFMPLDKANFYDRSLLNAVGAAVFSTADAELRLASTCYATNLDTASVSHSMRAIETPIKAIAKRLRVKLAKDIDLATWGDIHREIDNKIKALRLTRHTKRRDEEIAFYAEANTEFGYFKDVWRNFVSHSRKNL